MAEVNYELGKTVQGILQEAGVETPMFENIFIAPIAESFHKIMQGLGLDLNDDSLAGTPNRVAKMYQQEVFYGLDYKQFPACTTVENKCQIDELILSKGIDVMSMCEHHFVPFIGTAAVGYIPGTKLLGLSKLNRVVDFFARRPQIQERLTQQIFLALSHVLETEDVAVVIKAKHYCVKLRGVKQNNTETITSKMSGRFMEKRALREEFLSLIRE